MGSKLQKSRCEACGTTFRHYNIGQRTCSRKCYGQIKSKQARVSCFCSTCGKEFYLLRSKARDGRGKYCSRQCSQSRPRRFNTVEALELWHAGNNARRIALQLNVSPITISTWLKRQGIYEPRHASGADCHNWKGGVKLTALVRASLRERTQNRCEDCNYNEHPEILQVHHKDRDRNNNDLDNLLLLCPNCHMWQHYLSQSGLYTKHTFYDAS